MADSFLGMLSDGEAQELTALGRSRRYERGRALFHLGQVGEEVVILRSGRVKVVGETPEGREPILAFLGPGELIGELPVLDDRPRMASVIALERVDGLVVAMTDFRGFLARHPEASLALLALLIRRLRDADAKQIEFAALDTLGRVASRLLELCDRFGLERDGAIEITLPLSQEELAGWTASSIEAVVKALGTMRGLGWVSTGRRSITVQDVTALRTAAR